MDWRVGNCSGLEEYFFESFWKEGGREGGREGGKERRE